MIEVKVIERESDFVALKDEWNGLLARSTANTIFLTWEWLYSWWEHFQIGRRLAIRLVYDDDQLVGIAPFYYEAARIKGIIPLKSLQWLGTGEVGSDYLNVICEPIYED